MDKSTDLHILELARTQRQVFTRSQVLELGLSDGAIKQRLRTGRWCRLAPGVYTFPGVPVDNRTLVKAATLAIPGAVASHESAADLHAFAYLTSANVAVTAPRGANHKFPLARVHEYEGIHDCDRAVVDGIPVTSPALTVFHLAAVVHPKRVERILDDRLNSRSVGLPEMLALSDFWARKGRPGAPTMRRLLATRGPGFIAPESALEAAFIDLVRRFDLPEPKRQFATPWDRCEGRIDFAFAGQKILIELDGRRWHGRDADFNKDRERDRKAQLAGWVILRFTWHEVTQRPEHVADELRKFLRR